MTARADLGRTQGLFWSLITAPEGVRPGLDDLVRRGEAAPGDLDAMIDAATGMSAADRLDIYANMYFFRLLDCLKEDFPKLLEALGPGRFHNLATDYLLACPSEHPSLRFVGRRLPAFLESHALGLESPVLADVARLEWARSDLFDAPDATPLARADLASLPQDDAGDVRLNLVPAFRLLTLAYDAPRVWREMNEKIKARAVRKDGTEDGGPACLHEGTADAPPLPHATKHSTRVRVWRQGFTVFHKAIDDEEAASLEAVLEGDSLGRIAQRLSAGRTEHQATDRVGRMLQSWIDDGLLTA